MSSKTLKNRFKETLTYVDSVVDEHVNNFLLACIHSSMRTKGAVFSLMLVSLGGYYSLQQTSSQKEESIESVESLELEEVLSVYPLSNGFTPVFSQDFLTKKDLFNQYDQWCRLSQDETCETFSLIMDSFMENIPRIQTPNPKIEKSHWNTLVLYSHFFIENMKLQQRLDFQETQRK